MLSYEVVRENWLTRKPHDYATEWALILAAFLSVTSMFYIRDLFHAEALMSATRYTVFAQHEYWRAWTSLFAHADLGHLISNLVLFVPLTFLLTGYFGVWYFPLLGILMGGFINMVVLTSMPENTALIGISGVVNWMGSSWLSLFLLIDRRHSWGRRIAHVIFLTVILFVPETYKPEVSYYSHFLGFVLGILSAAALYFLNRKKFLSAEVIETVVDEPIID